MVQLNESQVATPNNLIYDSELPVEYGTVTLAISPSADGKIEKGQVIDVDFDNSTGAAAYSVHAASGVPCAIVAEDEPFVSTDTEVVVSVFTAGNLKANKIVTDVDLTDADVAELRKVGIVLK